MGQPLISQGTSEKVWMLDQSKEVVVVVGSRDVVDVVESGKRAKKKRTKTNQPKECYGPERSGGIRMAETKSKERNVGRQSRRRRGRSSSKLRLVTVVV